MPDTPQKVVKVNGLGTLAFPGDMPDEEVNQFIRTQLKHRGPTDKEKAAKTHKTSPANLPMQTEVSEHHRQNPNEGPSVPFPGFPHLGGDIVNRPENWFDKNIPYTTGIAQVLVKQLVGISKLAKSIDAAMGIDKPIPLKIRDGKREISFPNTLEELPSLKKLDDRMNKKIEDFAEEGPSNKEELRGQLIADLTELDLGEEEMEQVGKMIVASEVFATSGGPQKFLDYVNQYKLLTHGKNITRRTMISSFVAGSQALLNDGDVGKAIEEAKITMKTQPLFEVAGFGVGAMLPKGAEAAEHDAREIGDASSKVSPHVAEVLSAAERQSRAEEHVENVDNYATVGITEDPAEKIAEGGKTAGDVTERMSIDDKNKDKKKELTARDKFLLDSLRAWRVRLEAATAAIE